MRIWCCYLLQLLADGTYLEVMSTMLLDVAAADVTTTPRPALMDPVQHI